MIHLVKDLRTIENVSAWRCDCGEQWLHELQFGFYRDGAVVPHPDSGQVINCPECPKCGDVVQA